MTDTHVAPPLTRRQAREIERRTGQRPVAVAPATFAPHASASATGVTVTGLTTPVLGTARSGDSAALAADIRARIDVATATAQAKLREAAHDEPSRVLTVDRVPSGDVMTTAELAKGSLAAFAAQVEGPAAVRPASVKAAKPLAVVRLERRRRGAGLAFAASAAAVATIGAVTPGLGVTPDNVAQASLVNPDTVTEPEVQSGDVTEGAVETAPLVDAPSSAVDRGQYAVTSFSPDDVAETVEPPVVEMQYFSPYPTGAMNEGYGTRGGAHNGIDMVGGGCGADLVAVTTGTVTFAGEQGGYGNHVELDLGDGTTISYSHLQPGGIGVSVGQVVEAGGYIGAVGTTGNSTGCHLHFEVKIDGEFVDPVSWLAERGITA